MAASVLLLLASLACAAPALAAPLPQDAAPTEAALPSGTPPPDCAECHLDVSASWSASPHAHAFDDPAFQEQWQSQGEAGDCLACHTTGYSAATGAYAVAGVHCEGCHGPAVAGHPPAAAPVRADTDYCGTCHTTTLHEWRVTGHAAEGVGCMDCHDPHSQQALMPAPDDLCLNCHKDDMGAYLEDLHIQKGIGCVDCHALVIPPETPPADGIVPTGHGFTLTAQTCVACHTDTLHAGFALPGYEHGAAAAKAETPVPVLTPTAVPQTTGAGDVLEAAQASRTLSALFQGSLIGLVLGGSTAWLVARNWKHTEDA
jgi:predicted CXXCH cytochrome family protein